MTKYIVNWHKAYYMYGTEEIEANSKEEAADKMDAIIGDVTGLMQYDPDNNTIEVLEQEETS